MHRALAILEQSSPADHPNVARDLTYLATLLKATNRVDESEPLMGRLLKIYNSSLGDEHPSTQNVAANLAIMEKELKE